MKKFLSILMVLVLGISVFAGCAAPAEEAAPEAGLWAWLWCAPGGWAAL